MRAFLWVTGSFGKQMHGGRFYVWPRPVGATDLVREGVRSDTPTVDLCSGQIVWLNTAPHRISDFPGLVHSRQLAFEHGRVGLHETFYAAGAFGAGDGADAGALTDQGVVIDLALH